MDIDEEIENLTTQINTGMAKILTVPATNPTLIGYYRFCTQQLVNQRNGLPGGGAPYDPNQQADDEDDL